VVALRIPPTEEKPFRGARFAVSEVINDTVALLTVRHLICSYWAVLLQIENLRLAQREPIVYLTKPMLVQRVTIVAVQTFLDVFQVLNIDARNQWH
jgi:hypothetical protein